MKSCIYFNLDNLSDNNGHIISCEISYIFEKASMTIMGIICHRNLADVDNDGRLTSEEFCLAMHLIDVAKTGQPLPGKLPAELIPPSYRRARAGSGVGLSSAVSQGGIGSTGQPLGSAITMASGGMAIPPPGRLCYPLGKGQCIHVVL